jgi:hypothetical protein
MVSVIRVGSIQFGGVAFGGASPAGKFQGQGSGTVELERDAFAKFIVEHGYQVQWEKATFCPNAPNTGLGPRDHDINCSICNGSGFLYFDPPTTPEVDLRLTYMLMQGIRLDQSYHAYGRWDVGTQMVTAMPEFTIDYFDRLTLCNGIARFRERVTRQPGTTTDKLRYAPLTIDHVCWVDRTGALKTFTANSDFTINVDEDSIEWILTAGLPDDMDRYSVVYTYRPRYIVQDLVHQHRDQAVDGGKRVAFPVQAIARLDFLIRDIGNDAPATREEDPFPK